MQHSYSAFFRRTMLGLALSFGAAAHAQTPIAITGPPYSQTFDGLGATGTSYPDGWTGIRYAGTGTANATLTPVVVAATSNSGAIYNAGADAGTDRALGSLGSGSTAPAFGAVFVNQTGAAVSQVSIVARGEQWRTGSAGPVVERLVFEYSLDATNLNAGAGTWAAVPALDIVEVNAGGGTPGPIDGNVPANSAAITATIQVNWPTNATMWIRWRDTDDQGNDALLAVDDFRLSTPILSTRTARHNALSVYPNPATDVLNVRVVNQAAKGPVSITDLTGRTVLTATLVNGMLDVRALPAGYYLVQTTEGATHQLVKH